ncbi:MAG: hypothetical protein IKT42_04605 [Clostridia bacterium]|nr:hypothetical protein [Clostridia bacterium]
MTKRIKTILITALSVCFSLLTFLGIFLPTAQHSASASTFYTNNEYFTKNWQGTSLASWDYGASVFGDECNGLRFTLHIKDNWINTRYSLNSGPSHDEPDRENESFQYGRRLTIVRKNADGSETDVAAYALGHWHDASFMYKKSYTTDGQQIELNAHKIFGYREHVTAIDTQYSKTVVNGLSAETIAQKNGGELVFCSGAGTLSGHMIRVRDYEIDIKVPSPYTEYYVKFNYSIFDGNSFIGNHQLYTIKSSSTSIYNKLETFKNAGSLESELGNDETKIAYANAILQDRTIGDITVNYLKQIGSTPFAMKTVKVIEDVEFNAENGATFSEISSCLSFEERHVLKSVIIGFTRDDVEGNIYTAKYDDSVWIQTTTSDGKALNYYLDINKSYEDFYTPLSGGTVFTDELYNHIFYQKIYTAYPELDELLLTPDEVYGYFGFVVIPRTQTLNELWYELFDNQVNFDGVINGFEYDELLNQTEYDNLLKDYQYSFLERVWNGVTGLATGVEARHFIIFADSTTTAGLVSKGNDNGQGGQIMGGIKDVTATVGEWFSTTWETVSGFFNSTGGTVTTIVVIAAIVAVVIVIVKLRGNSGGIKSNKNRRK